MFGRFGMFQPSPPNENTLAMEKLEELLKRVTYLEECNRRKDEEIRNLRTDVDNLCPRSTSHQCKSASLNSDLDSAPTTVLPRTDDSYAITDDESESFVVTVDPRIFEQTEQRVKRLDALATSLTDANIVDRLGDVEAKLGELQEKVNSGGKTQPEVSSVKLPFHSESKETSSHCKDVASVANRLDTVQRTMDSLTHKVSAIEGVNEKLSSRLRNSEEKAEQCDGALNDLKERMTLQRPQSIVLRHVERTTQLEGRVQMLDKRMAPCEHSLTIVEGKVGVLDESIDILKARMPDDDSRAKRLQELETDLAQTQAYTKDRFQNVYFEVNSLAQKIPCIENYYNKLETRLCAEEESSMQFKKSLETVQAQVNSLAQKIPCIESDYNKLETRLCAEEERSMQFEKSQETVQAQVTENIQDLSVIKRCQDNVTKAAFNIRLLQGTQLAPNTEIQLNQCEEVLLGDNCFDREQAFYTVPVDGIYLFSLTLLQEGHGQLTVKARPHDGEWGTEVCTYVNSSYLVGMRQDIRSGCAVMRLTCGQRMGVYVKSLQGTPKVLWCYLCGGLLSSY